MSKVLFGLQEVTIDTEDSITTLGRNSQFTPHHKIVYSDGHVDKRTRYQGLGIVTSFPITPMTDNEINKTLLKTGITRVDEDLYAFEFIVELPNSLDETQIDKNHRYLQILKVEIDGRDYTVVNVHYHYNSDVNRKTNDLIVSLIKNIRPSIIMGDFNSNPTFNGYIDLLANTATFFNYINSTDRLDHIFVSQDLHELWTFSEPHQLFKLNKITLDNVDRFISMIEDSKMRTKLSTIKAELQEYRDILNKEDNLKKKDRLKPYLITDKNDDLILSDHILFTFNVTTDKNTKFCIGTLNILAPHNSTAYQLNPLLRKRVKDVRRIAELVDVIRTSCECKENHENKQTGGSIDYRAKYLKYKAKYIMFKRNI